jgi:Domain of unknown function (DUF4193)
MGNHERQLDDQDSGERAEAPRAKTRSGAPRPRDVADGEVESIQEIIEKKEAGAADEEEDAGIALTREERLEPLAVKVVPPQSSEFVCKNCYLVKHRSQLKDEKRMLCRDCA